MSNQTDETDSEKLMRNATGSLKGDTVRYDSWVSVARNFDFDKALKSVVKNYSPQKREGVLNDSELILQEYVQAIQDGKLAEKVWTYTDFNENKKIGQANGILTSLLEDVVYDHIKGELPYGSDIHGKVPLGVGGIMCKSRRKLKGYE